MRTVELYYAKEAVIWQKKSIEIPENRNTSEAERKAILTPWEKGGIL